MNDDYSVAPLWKLSNDGSFNAKATWNHVRESSPSLYLYSIIWNNIVPRKCSFLTWRLLKGWIPVDSILRTKGMQIVYKCQYCSAYETLYHVFVDCEVAWNTWAYFARLFEVNISKHMSIRNC
ncbi:hypothetical protein LIER_38967 [Lithospermum erythrorhizon]|uniref:Reverse transcriptase zinc-binding domain-containing protein n=1 Tax=Lithospermum erythrorhizon TaxID=34254 RepID=A0AAV3QC32_LITER